ncbi:Na+/H+ antiporter NhaA [Psychromonas sp. Urea-02u-13]|uniref:Na+/H+ antiporter NhaA n=1 Tax=Psychromonas sp. Urea-02u-13 TaxID=2058326 RepID=UPI000C32341F|nr:Na+/H+ antiporter NhaA [Psychromonas sp. Urea-02u-13]PKG40684.1 Na+/H+ antiporter NhaA [Psychromonas sp. Urea-02u-13]
MSSHKWHWLHNPITGGVLLVIAATIALLWANIAPDHYHHVWHNTLWEVSTGLSDKVHQINLHKIANEFLMAIFFFFIGLEIKRELLDGELSSMQKAALPLFAALGGVIFPAGIYYFFNTGLDSVNGWGIPMATDIAFALGVLAIVGSRVPVALKVFLSALAIGDDLMAVVVIAIFYTEQIFVNELMYGIIGLLVLALANRLGVRNNLFYYTVGMSIVWISFLASGVHATVAGVAVAFTIPSRREISMTSYLDQAKSLLKGLENDRHDEEDVLSRHAIKSLKKIKSLSYQAANPLQLKEDALHPLATLIIVPFFALGNAGVIIDGSMLDQLTNPIVLGIAAGLIVGKPLGIYLFTKLLIMLNWGALPKGVTWTHVIGAGFLAGIGFTMSLFITDLAFSNPEHQIIAKVAVFVASLVSGLIGYIILMRAKPAVE